MADRYLMQLKGLGEKTTIGERVWLRTFAHAFAGGRIGSVGNIFDPALFEGGSSVGH